MKKPSSHPPSRSSCPSPQESSSKKCSSNKSFSSNPLETSNQLTISALHAAILDGNLEAVRKLIKNEKVDVNCTGDMGWTPLRYACTRGDLEMCRLLVESGAQVNPPVGERKWTVLHTVAGLDHVECLEYLVEEGGALAITENNDGFTAFHVAVVYGNQMKSIQILASKAKADVELKDSAGNTPLALACKNHRLEAIKVLLFELRVNPFSFDFNNSGLDDECVQDLVKKGQEEERERNNAWVDLLNVSRKLILVSERLSMSSELQFITLSQLRIASHYSLSNDHFRILSKTFLDRKSIGHILYDSGKDIKRCPRLLSVISACKSYLYSD